MNFEIQRNSEYPYMYVSISLTVLLTPHESLAAQRLRSASTGGTSRTNVHCQVHGKDAIQTTETKGDSRGAVAIPSSFSLSDLDDLPCLGAVSSQRTATDTTRITTSSAWTARTDASGRCLNQVLLLVTPTIMHSQMAEVNASSDSQMSTTDASKNAFLNNSARPEESSQITDASVVSTERFPTDSSNNANSSAYVTPPNPPGRTTPALPLGNSFLVASQMVKGSSLPSMKPGAEQFPNTSSNPREIPKGVFVVCDDFLQKHLKRAGSIYEKTKACKGCENRSKLRYAVWNNKSKQWQIIRSYPEKVPAKVAFKECRRRVMNIPCERTSCSFAHGQEELLMWTLEREGSEFRQVIMSAIYSCLRHCHE